MTKGLFITQNLLFITKIYSWPTFIHDPEFTYDLRAYSWPRFNITSECKEKQKNLFNIKIKSSVYNLYDA